jgi:hypothetical protein
MKAASTPERGGLSVVEALVAIAILSSSIIPIILFLSVGTETVRGTRDISGAAFVANRTFEELRARPFDDVLGSPRSRSLPSIDLGAITYRRTLSVSPLAPESGLRAVLLWLKVEWARDRRKTLNYEVGTVLSEVR